MLGEDVRSELGPRTVVMFVAAVAVVILCWIVGNPRSAGPDEPSHMVAGAALVRGETTGTPDPIDPTIRLMNVPAMVGEPNPACWAFVPEATPACMSDTMLRTDVVEAQTKSFEYPPFGLVLPGVASFVPWPTGYAYVARGLNAVLPVALISATLLLLSAHRRMLAVGALLGLTPIAWFTFGVVNPSALAIAGGLALTTGCLLLPVGTSHEATVLMTGWLAATLPRRDGPLWAAIAVIAACLALDLRPSDLWRLLPGWGRVTIVVTAPIPVGLVLARGERGFELALAASGLAIIAYELLITRWSRTTALGRRLLTAGLAAAAGATLGIVLLTRPGGYDATLLGLVVGNTGDHLVQLVGVLGWLNAPVPMSGVLLFWATFGGLVTLAAVECPRSALAPIIGLTAAIGSAWLLELGQGASYGDYWQGRYSMPLVVGLPLLAVWRTGPTALERLALPLMVVWWLIVNLAFFAAQRRWAVPVGGTWYVWRWDTWNAPLDPILLLTGHAVATAWLAHVVFRGPRPLLDRELET